METNTATVTINPYGTGFNGATTVQLWKHDKRDTARHQRRELQWSHNSSVVETGVAPMCSTHHRSFNGATTVQLWKLSVMTWRVSYQRASMEPQQFSCGNVINRF